MVQNQVQNGSCRHGVALLILDFVSASTPAAIKALKPFHTNQCDIRKVSSNSNSRGGMGFKTWCLAHRKPHPFYSSPPSAPAVAPSVSHSSWNIYFEGLTLYISVSPLTETNFAKNEPFLLSEAIDSNFFLILKFIGQEILSAAPSCVLCSALPEPSMYMAACDVFLYPSSLMVPQCQSSIRRFALV
jgi:hypothetical protein